MFEEQDEEKDDIVESPISAICVVDKDPLSQQLSINSRRESMNNESYQESEGFKPTKREEDQIVRNPTNSRSLKAVYLPLMLQTYDLITDTCLFILIMVHLNSNDDFYELILISWITVISIIHCKEIYRCFRALHTALKPIAHVQDNNNDGTPDWMQYLIDSPWIFIVAICHPLAFIQYKEAWINYNITPIRFILFADLLLQEIPSIFITIFVFFQINKLIITIISICSFIGSIVSITYHVWRIYHYNSRKNKTQHHNV